MRPTPIENVTIFKDADDGLICPTPIPISYGIARVNPELIRLEFHTPVGLAVYFLPNAFAKSFVEALQGQISGIVIPPKGLVL